MLHNDRGGSKIVALVLLAVVAAAVYIGFRLIPVYMAAKEFEDTMAALCQSSQIRTDADITKHLVRQAEEIGIPIGAEDITITKNPTLTIETQWQVTLDFPGGYSYTLAFHPIADSTGVHDADSGR